MDTNEYRKWAQEAVEWCANYRESLPDMPVRSNAQPGDTLKILPLNPPEEPEDFAQVFADFTSIVPPGMTHWQHPRFFAYFPANASLPSVIAEQLTAALGVNSMLWQTSPVATEMEIRMLEWLGQLTGVPSSWRGVIQDGGSACNLSAVLTMREHALDWQGNEQGLFDQKQVRIYFGEHSHSSIPKAIWLAGIGRANAVSIQLDASGSMDANALNDAISEDKQAGMLPAGVCATLGATGTGNVDNLDTLGDVLNQHNLYGHIDAAWAGSATICEEHQHLLTGIEKWDSYSFNPHKWFGANFDLAAHFLKEPQHQIKTMHASPAYLKTTHVSNVDDFCNWTVPLGRRFRALKLWFVIRAFGAQGIRTMIRNHIEWTKQAAAQLAKASGFVLVGKPNLGLILFRHEPAEMDQSTRDAHNEKLLDAINADGFVYLTPTRLADGLVLRMNIGTTLTTQEDVEASTARIIKLANELD